MFSTKAVYNRENRLRGDGTALVHIRIIYNRVTRHYNPGIRITPDQWRKGRVVRRRDAHDLNEYLDNIIYSFNRYYRSCRTQNRCFSIEGMIESLDRVDEVSFLSFARDLVRDQSGDYAKSTNQKRDDVLGRLSGFRSEVYMSEITYQFLVDFRQWLKRQMSKRKKRLSDNYITSILVVLRYMVNEARRRQLITIDPFVGFRMQRTAKVIVVHDEREIDLIERLDLSAHPYLVAVRDRYLWMCYTGMRFSDVERISRVNVEDGLLKYVAGKTRRSKGKEGRVPMHLFDDKAYVLLEKYGFAWRAYSNKYFNERIKDVMILAKIDKHVSAHTARHSFKSIMLERGYPIHIIAEFMAHSSTVTTESYGKISDGAVMRKI